MKTTQAIKFKNGARLDLVDLPLVESDQFRIALLQQSGHNIVINTKLSNRAMELITQSRKVSRLQKVNVQHQVNGLHVTDCEAFYEYNAAIDLSGFDYPMLINIEINPEIAEELAAHNEKPFIISGCHVMDASLNLDLREQKNELWIDDPAVQPHPKNERCVNPHIELFKNEYNVKEPGDVIGPGVTLARLQEKELKYDELKKQLDEIRAKSQPMIEIAERYERIQELFKTEYGNEDLEPYGFIGKILEVLVGKEEPETFDRADYRDE